MTRTKFIMLLTGASAIFVCLVLPLIEPMGLDRGLPLWWLDMVPHVHRTLAAFILAGLLAISITRTKFIMLLTGASAIFAYLLSLLLNLRDLPNPPLGTYGGSNIWWLQALHEAHWILETFILAGLLAISIKSTKFIMLLTGASAIFTYLVSPTRDPNFGKFSAPNGGAPHWWLEGMREEHWILAAFILAGLLSICLTLELWRWCKSQTQVAHRRRSIPRKTAQLRDFLLGLMHFVIGSWMWLVLSYGFFSFLLDQWLID
jgi:uncharacterized membrane protein